MTYDTSRCDMYKKQSENVKPRSYCKVPQTLLTKLVQENKNDYRIPITEDECKVGSLSLPEIYLTLGDGFLASIILQILLRESIL